MRYSLISQHSVHWLNIPIEIRIKARPSQSASSRAQHVCQCLILVFFQRFKSERKIPKFYFYLFFLVIGCRLMWVWTRCVLMCFSTYVITSTQCIRGLFSNLNFPPTVQWAAHQPKGVCVLGWEVHTQRLEESHPPQQHHAQVYLQHILDVHLR